MKKVFVLALVVILMVSLAVPAFAAAGTNSPAADVKELMPELVSSACDQVTMTNADEIEDLPEEVQEIMEEAKEKLAEVVPEGMAVRYFFYADICEECNDSSAVFEIDEYEEVIFMQYVDGKWVELEYTVNADGTFNVAALVDGPVVVIVK